MPDLSIIIVAYNVKELMEECLTCIRNSKDRLNKQILFVDNCSEDGTAAMVKENFPEVYLIECNENLGFIRANNLAYSHAKGKYILMLNSDAFIFEHTLQKTFDFMEQNPKAGVLGGRLIRRNGDPAPSIRYFPTPWRFFKMKMGLEDKLPFGKSINDNKQSRDKITECDWVAGCFLLIRKEIVDKMDFFLRPDFFMYNDDNDLCLRVKRKGWKVFFYPEDVIHLGGATQKKIDKAFLDKQKRSEKLRMESDYIHFRKNYNACYAFLHFFFIALFDLILIAKRFLLMKKEINVKERWDHIGVAFSILKRTEFGNISIH